MLETIIHFFSPGISLWSSDLLDEFSNNTVIAGLKMSQLMCDTDGSSQNDIVPNNNNYGFGDIYFELFDALDNEFGDYYSIEFFAYDWRLSSGSSASELNSFITSNAYDKVVLVCHSMGGLVASGYLALGSVQQSKVKSIVMLGSPLLGSPLAPYLWGSEDFTLFWGENFSDEILNILNTLRSLHIFDLLIKNFSSIYELFPTKYFFDNAFAGDNYLVTRSNSGVDQTVTTYSATRTVLEENLNFFNSDLMDQAEIFHDSLCTGGIHVSETVNSFFMAGYNKETVKKIKHSLLGWSVDSNDLNGDGIVPISSATLADRQASRSFFAESISHIDLVSDYDCLRFIGRLISGSTSLSSISTIFSEPE